MSARGAGPSRGGGGGGGGAGGRGRGRGGGGGRAGGFSRGGGGMGSHLMGTLSWTELAELDKAKPNRHAYPPVDAKPVLHKASVRERRIVRRQLDFLRAQQCTPWWPLTGNELLSAGKAVQTNGSEPGISMSTAKAALAPVSLKRGGAYIPRYSDKFRRTALDTSTPSTMVNGGAKVGRARKSDAAETQNQDFMATLQREAFPVNLWRSYIEGESRRQERKQEASAASRRRRGDWKRIVEGVELTGGEDAASDGPPSEEEEEAAEADEYEDDVEDDYADNYFDNGEDDDIGDGEAGQEADVYD